MQERYRTVLAQVQMKSILLHFEYRFCFGIWSHIFSLPLRFCFFVFFFRFLCRSLNVSSHILEQLNSFRQEHIYYTHQRVQNYVFTMLIKNSLWHARIGIFNLSRNYIKKIKVPRFPLINCRFSVLFVQFLFLVSYYFFV